MTAQTIVSTQRAAVGGQRTRMLLLQVMAELRRHRRAPDFAVAAIGLPILFYLMFGAPRAAEPIPGQGTVGQYTLVAFAIYGILSIGLFGIGSTITEERGRGDLRLIRVTPLPAAAYVAAKVAFVVVACVAVVVLLGLAGALTGAGMEAGRWAALAAVLVGGGILLAPIGLLVGFLARPGSSAAVSLLILMPLSLAAGVFMPVSELPSVVRQVSEVTPTYHLAAIARWAAGFDPSVHPVVDLAWVGLIGIGSAIVALVVYRRFIGEQFA